MVEVEKKRIAEICTKIINEPEKNINEVSILLQANKDKGVLFLSLTKVFKNIAPLYRIRLHSNKVKHKNENLSITEFDRTLFKQYNLFVKEICNSDSAESYKSAAELLKSLDHFNFSDRIVAKVLLGTTRSHSVAMHCTEALVDRIKNDQVGDTISIIVDRCLDYRFSHYIVKAMLESQYLQKCVEIRIEKECYYEKESIEKRKKEKLEKPGKGFFSKKFLVDKKERKDEKQRLQLQKETKMQEKYELNSINEKTYIKTVNAMQRLYFTILKDQDKVHFEDTFIGVRKYIRIIRKEFHEGLYTLLLDAIKIADVGAALEGILTIFEIYKDCGYDFKRVINVLFQMAYPFNYSLTAELVQKFCSCVRHMFLDIVQSKMRAIVFTQRLMHCRIIKYVPELDRLIKDLEVKYNLEFTDFDMRYQTLEDLNASDVDRITIKPFYEYFLFKKIR
ncbi:uncharacterized protein VICG_01041 [Vittaforma corneae ATCC 50505]|uniref:Nucleolar complex-associated protein 3 N-terminal domain-containing protein n=1 Tax=Vittaforma corneae (strain ATCC 50505) TaxID=993615 RepID=L2GNF9_VITCO|nr:uncharacterized protein VICG_01041 [Vittaforma corneae ATCC 50505]ELA41857.1 hypothetical protein VICG_01041 [Vittaforma corneae ATCC 50505]